ncbi:MAG: hypothetical protein WC548_02775 [Candidatus Pacearchaeota archaeon]
MVFKILETNVRTGEPLIGFTAANSITFNSSLTRKYKLENYNFVQVMYDEDNSDKIVLGFKFLKDRVTNALKLSSSTNGGSFVSGNSLVNGLNLEIKTLKEKKFTPKEIPYGNENIISIEISKKFQKS